MSTNFKMGEEDLCTAVYINDRFALTAAHCLSIFEGGQAGITVRGDTDYQEIIGVKRAIGHVNFIAPKYEHDIALLELGMYYIFETMYLNRAEQGLNKA